VWKDIQNKICKKKKGKKRLKRKSLSKHFAQRPWKKRFGEKQKQMREKPLIFFLRFFVKIRRLRVYMFRAFQKSRSFWNSFIGNKHLEKKQRPKWEEPNFFLLSGQKTKQNKGLSCFNTCWAVQLSKFPRNDSNLLR